MNDLFSFKSSALPKSARLVAFRGCEALCRPFLLEVHFTLLDDGDFDMAGAIGSKATLAANRGDGREPVQIHGVLASMQHVYEVAGTALYRAEVVPRLWFLGQTKHSRVFTQMTVPDIVKTLLDEGGLAASEVEFRLARVYAVEEHVCQYKESNLDFLHRWMELEGLYYFFEHGEDHEVLVITDNRSSHEASDQAPVRYHPITGVDASAGECFESFTCQHVALPERVRVADYDYARPNLEVSGTAIVCATGMGEVVVHGARAFDPGRGQRLAELRADELRAGQVVFHAAGSALRIRTGYTFRVEDHGRDAFNASYLATELTYFGNQSAGSAEIRKLTGAVYDEVYRAEVRAIRADTQFRPRQMTNWPRVHGLEGAVVDGEANDEYAQIDEQGRYRVKLHLDESDLRDGKASTFVRMIQPHGGTVEGWHFPLRKGTEVMIAFLGGDPDRPVIAGVTPNAQTPSPVAAANHTTNVIQTGGANRIELEDQQGSQWIGFSTPTMDSSLRMGAPDEGIRLKTSGNALISTGGILNMFTTLGKIETIGESSFVRVGGAVEEEYGTSQETKVTTTKTTIVGGDVSETYKSALATTVGGQHFHAYKTYVGVGGDTKLTAGPVHLSSGPVDAVTNTVNWKAPSVTFTTPDFQIQGGKSIRRTGRLEEFVGDFNEVMGTQFQIVDSSSKIVGKENKMYGFQGSVGVTKVDVCAAKFVNKGILVAKNGTGVENAGVRIWFAGITTFG